jgi:hypothetical protein
MKIAESYIQKLFPDNLAGFRSYLGSILIPLKLYRLVVKYFYTLLVQTRKSCMEKLTDNQKGIIALVALVIITPMLWNAYQQKQKDDQYRQTCEKLKAVREEVIRRMNAGQQISPQEASGAYQIGLVTPDNCDPNSKPRVPDITDQIIEKNR